MSKELKFICPKCKGEILEEVMTDVVQYSSIGSISEDGSVDYCVNGISHEGGEVELYQCHDCAYILKIDNDDNVNCEDELVQWIKKYCKQE